ncbi:MAG: hypothetical protein ABSB74_06395 [Tepidisphaeraceae bacterium]
MADDLLRKYAGRASTLATELDTETEADSDDLGSFGWLRSSRDRCLMLQFFKKDGSVVAVPYTWLERVEFHPKEGITLSAQGKKIRIRGRHLNAEVRPHVALFDGICRGRVPWILEAERAASVRAGEEATVVEEIEA